MHEIFLLEFVGTLLTSGTCLPNRWESCLMSLNQSRHSPVRAGGSLASAPLLGEAPRPGWWHTWAKCFCSGALGGRWFSFHTLGSAERLKKVGHLPEVTQLGGEEAGSAPKSALFYNCASAILSRNVVPNSLYKCWPLFLLPFLLRCF